jgi:hypothetical protein
MNFVSDVLIDAEIEKARQEEIAAHRDSNSGALYEVSVYSGPGGGGVRVQVDFLATGSNPQDAANNYMRDGVMKAPTPGLIQYMGGGYVFYSGGPIVFPSRVSPAFANDEKTRQDIKNKQDAVERAAAALHDKSMNAIRAMSKGDPNIRSDADHPAPGDVPHDTGEAPAPDNHANDPGPRESEPEPDPDHDNDATPGGGRPPRRLALADAIVGPNVVSGDHDGRAWCDFNGDGFFDFCRVLRNNRAPLSSNLLVTLSTGNQLGQMAAGATITSQGLDVGYAAGRGWVDFNGDKKADYCRVVGVRGAYRLEVTLSTGTAFKAPPILSSIIDPGTDDWGVWVDWDGDGFPDYVRVVGTQNFTDAGIAVTFGTGTGFGETKVFKAQHFDWGYPETRMWIDMDADGKPDFVRLVGSHSDPMIAVTTSAGRNGFGPTTILPLSSESGAQ